MEQEKNNKGIIILLVVLNVILLALVILLATGTISFNNNTNNDSNNIINNNNNSNEERVLSLEEQKGLELYKYFVGNGTGPFKWETNVVTNYDEVLSKMTDSYKKSFENSNNGFNIPVNENGTWKNFGGFGTDQESKFKDIKVTLADSCKIHYEITYTYTNMGDTNKIEHEAKNEFVVKTNTCTKDDVDNDFSNGYKVDSFKLIYGLKFE